MAIVYRNPMPTTGALFIENPRRRKRSTRKGMRRKGAKVAGARLAYDALPKRRKAAKKRRKGGSAESRRNAKRAMKLYHSGKAPSLKAAWRMVKRNPWYESPNYRDSKGTGARTKAARHQAAARKGASSAKAKAWSAALRKAAKELDKEGSRVTVAAMNKRAKAIQARRSSTSRASGASRGKSTKWTRFMKKVGGRGLTQKQISRLYKMTPAKRKFAVQQLPKPKGRKPKAQTGYARRKQMRRTASGRIGSTGQIGAFSLPFLQNRRRRNPKPIAKLMGLVGRAQAMVGKVPVVKHLAWALPAAALGYGVYYVHSFTAPKVVPLLERIPLVGGIVSRNPFLSTSLLLGPILGFAASKGLLSAQAAVAVSAAAVTAGVVLDKAAPLASAAADAGLPLPDDMALLEEEPPPKGAIALGDGMAYNVGAASDAFGAMSAYADASLADAAACPADFHHSELSAALSGHSYPAYFPPAPHSARSNGPYSRHAGMMGHRYGWLMKMIGPQKFARLAMLPPKKRMHLIRLLKQQALQTVSHALHMEKTSAETASLPVTGGMNGHGGHGSATYGALMYAGSGY